MKRGESGLSLVACVDKPYGVSSHDVVSKCRRIFGEKRVGHAGTLDPLATGVLLVCVGSAARLDKYLVGHDKTYRVDVAFGASTETDDSEGSILARMSVPSVVYDASFARSFVKTLPGKIMQVPPVYSALKKDGKKACDEARKGNTVELEPRAVEIYDIAFIDIVMPDEECDFVRWRLDVSASKGTYIRSFARDLGQALGTVAHVARLRRTQSGNISIEDCVSLDTLARLSTQAAFDPLALLDCRFAYADAAAQKRIVNGNFLEKDALHLMEQPRNAASCQGVCCFPVYHESTSAPTDGECIALICENKLAAMYRFDALRNQWRADCIFNPPVIREGKVL